MMIGELDKKFRPLVIQTFWQTLSKVITAGIGIVIVALITRSPSLGPAGIGMYTLATTFIFFFCIASDFGFNAYVLPLFLQHKEASYWRKLLGLRLIWSLALMIFAALVLILWPNQDPLFKQTALWGLGAIVCYSLFTTANALFQHHLRYDLYCIAVSLGALPSLAIAYFVVINHLPVPYLLLGFFFSWLTTATVSLFFAKKFVPTLVPIFDNSFIRQVFIGVWPVAAALLLNMVYFRVDAFLLAAYKGYATAGTYNLAYQVFQSILVLPTFVTNAFYPLMLKELTYHSSSFIQTFRRAVISMFVFSLFGSLLTYLLAPFIIQTLAGNGYEDSVWVLRYLGFSLPAFFVSALYMWTLVVLKKYKEMLFIYCIGLVCNLCLNLLLIPLYSYQAATIVTNVSEYLILLIQIIFLHQVLKSAGLKSPA